MEHGEGREVVGKGRGKYLTRTRGEGVKVEVERQGAVEEGKEGSVGYEVRVQGVRVSGQQVQGSGGSGGSALQQLSQRPLDVHAVPDEIGRASCRERVSSPV